MESGLELSIFTILFLGGTFLAALIAGLGGFAFGIVAAAVWLYILTPLQTAPLIMGLGLVVQGYSVWKLRHALRWRRLAPFILGAVFGVALGVLILAKADPHYLRVGIGVVLVLFSLYATSLMGRTLQSSAGSVVQRIELPQVSGKVGSL